MVKIKKDEDMIVSRLRSLIMMSGVAVILAACQTSAHKQATDIEWDIRSREMVEDRIAESARRSTNALETLAMIERAKAEPISSGLSEALRSLPHELQRPTNAEWSGPAEDFARRLADNIGYEFITQGKEPSVPIMIHLSIQDVPIIKVFENIGMHIQPRAALIVDPNVKRVEFVYDPPGDAEWIEK